MKPSGQPGADEATRYAMQGFVVRTPLLPARSVLDLGRDLQAFDCADEDAFARACEAVRARLRALVALPEVMEALFVASPSLVESLPRWHATPGSGRGRRVERSLVKYLARMSTRPTPFGLFSGCSVGRFGDETRLSLAPRGRYARHSRLDMDYLFSLTEALNRDPGLRRRLVYRPNDTLVRSCGRLRYVEPRVGADNAREYRWVAAEATPYLEGVLERSAAGATVAELAAALVAHDAEVSAEEAEAYVLELVDAHLLVSTLQPPLTGPEPTLALAEQLRGLGEDRVATGLEQVAGRLARLDAAGLGHGPGAYVSIVEALRALPAPVDPSRSVQVDLAKPADLAFGPNLRVELVRCAELFARCAAAVDRLAGFRAAFERRYGAAMAPLLEALDPEAGVFVEDASPADGSPLLEGLPPAPATADQGVRWRARHDWMLERLSEVWEGRRTELVLEAADLDTLFGASGTHPLATAFSLRCTLIAESAAAVDRGEFQLLLYAADGPGGARLLGRFAHVDPHIDALVRRHLRDEEEQARDAVWAEIVHLPRGRLGNISLRPVLRDYELTYMGRSAAPPERQLPLSDLLVGVRADTIRLWSRRLGRRVVPRLTNAHDYSAPWNLAPYRFLALLQAEGSRAEFAWDWGPLAGARFLPRVRCGRVVLAPAIWRMTRAELGEVTKGAGRERFLATRAWAERRRVPRLFHLADRDRQLLVDLQNPLSVDAFVETLRRRGGATLAEMLPAPDRLCVGGAEGAFTHEICVPVVRSARPEASAVDVVRPAPATAVRRRIAPGGDCLFAKIYACPSEADRVLTRAVRPLVSEVLGRGLAERWFFVRYGDPEHHLRVRFRGRPGLLLGEVLPRLHDRLAPWLEAGGVSRLVIDTYQPEIERYGGPIGLDLSERVFQVDSEAVMEALAQLEGDAGGEARWRSALRGLDKLIDDFGFDARDKRAIVARRRRECALESGADTPGLKHWLGRRFRDRRAALAALWAAEGDGARSLAGGLELWRIRSERLKPLVASLRAAEARAELWTPVSALVDSYLHMYVNRMARADARAHELVLFDFLHRRYRSVDGRANGAERRAPAQHRAQQDPAG